VLNDDLFFETSGEFFGVYEQVKPVLSQFRQQFGNPTLLTNLEQAAKRYEEWSEKRAPGHVAKMREWMKQERAAKKSAATA
jgi:hypothetical protein